MDLAEIAKKEGITTKQLKDGLQTGQVVFVKNRLRRISPLALGKGLKTKVNANIGTSPDLVNIKLELAKLRAAIEAGADSIMDLSTGGDIDKIRREI
ncbi:MAG: phosphomethylpyrimidine synthase ThiC, partial [candidate division WOR-3 bacterium]